MLQFCFATYNNAEESNYRTTSSLKILEVKTKVTFKRNIFNCIDLLVISFLSLQMWKHLAKKLQLLTEYADRTAG